MLPTVEKILDIFQGGDQKQKLAFIETCSIKLFKDQVREVSEKESTLENTCQLLDFLSRGCLDSEQYGLAERISESCYLLARSGCDLNLGETFKLRLFAGRAALNWISALQIQGDHKQIENLIDEPIGWLKKSGDADNYHILCLKKVESLLDLNSYAEAKKSFKKIVESRLSAIGRVQYRVIEYRIRMGKSKRAQLPIDFSKSDKAEKESINSFKGFMDVEEKMVRKKILEASYLLANSQKGMDPGEIEKIEPDLLYGRDWMKDHNFTATENDACWSLYLAYNRTKRLELAVEQLQRIRSNTESVRSTLSDPAARARLAERFPYLYACLCTLFYDLGRYEELLEAIEASKSRTEADMITQITEKPTTERAFTKEIKKLPKVLSRLKSHYYTFFVDDDCVYCVILTAAGKIRASKIELGKERIAYLSSISNPEIWGLPESNNSIKQEKPADLPQELSPFTGLIKSLLQKREILEGDHICYSSHDTFLNIPFQYINFKGEHLVDFFSLSKIPGAYSLLQIMKRNAYDPKKYVLIEVPSIQDVKNQEGWTALKEPGECLNEILSDGVRLTGEEADMDRLAEADLNGSVVHFSVHGKLRDNRMKGDFDPYKSSGLIMASRSKLPDLVLLGKGIGEEHLLTPEKIIKRELDLSNSHITLQESVGSPAERGRGGFPPGLEWAFLQNGASSILSANWSCSAKSKTLFLKAFYTKWLENGYSRADAWRQTVIELKHSDPTSDPSHWAAFSLIGDWR